MVGMILNTQQLHTFAVDRIKLRFVKKPFPCYFDKTGFQMSVEEIQELYAEYIKINSDLTVEKTRLSK